MKHTLLGKSGIEVSRITHGCMELGGGPWDVREDKENIALLNTALEHGITTFDTAESYGKDIPKRSSVRRCTPCATKVVLCTRRFPRSICTKRRHRRVRGAACAA